MTSSTKSRDRLLDSTLEFTASAPKDEFQELLRDTSQEANLLANVSKNGIAAALKAVGGRKRAAAKAQHLESVARYTHARVNLPTTMAEKLAMLVNLMKTSGDADMRLSLQHRKLTSVPEEEIDRLLTRLIQLSQAKD